MTRRYAVGTIAVVVVTAAALLLAGLELVSRGGERRDRPYNSTDVMFLQMMGPHHRQGLAIVRLAADRPVRADVRNLIDAITTTQTDELAQMSGWLRTWRQPATAPADAHAAHGGMPGTTDAEVKAVADSPDAQFEAAFLNLLLAHQDEAIQVARLELADGAHRDVRALADRITRSRAAQIKQLLGWLEPRGHRVAEWRTGTDHGAGAGAGQPSSAYTVAARAAGSLALSGVMVTSAKARLRPILSSRAVISRSVSITGRWYVIDSCTVVIGP